MFLELRNDLPRKVGVFESEKLIEQFFFFCAQIELSDSIGYFLRRIL